jgi:hypothetical protein
MSHNYYAHIQTPGFIDPAGSASVAMPFSCNIFMILLVFLQTFRLLVMRHIDRDGAEGLGGGGGDDFFFRLRMV